MRKVVIYRVVDKKGIGMYRSLYPLAFSYRRWHINPEEDDALMLELNQKVLPGINTGELNYGFRSVKQLKRWIRQKSDRVEMSDTGFVVNKYMIDLDKVARGETQVMFRMRHAVLIDTISMAVI